MRLKRAGILIPVAVTAALVLPYTGTALAKNDTDRPVPRGFLTGPKKGAALDIAMDYLRGAAQNYGVTKADLSELSVRSAYTSPHNGVTHVNLYQKFKGREVFGATATVNIAKDGSVVFVGDTLVGDLAAGASGVDETEATGAVEAAAEALDLEAPKNLQTLRRTAGISEETILTDGGISREPIMTRIGWQPTENGLRLAYQVVIDDVTDENLFNATVDAETGDLLTVDNWTIHDEPEQLVASLARTGKQETGKHVEWPTTHWSPNPVEDGSSYRVIQIPKESPNDGPRTLVTNPADGKASPYGWHDTNGVPGPEYTITRGNNVHAYLDQDNNNAPDFEEFDGGPGLTFDFPADLDGHATNYRAAAVTNLFYMNNIMHDVMYRYGFDEVSGNFQSNNYGRGGTGGDYVRAEAADGGGTNNANFSTPAADGGTPRMQMYLWPGTQFGLPNEVVVDGVGAYTANFARYSPAPTRAGLSGDLVYAGTGCTASQYPATLPTNWVAIVDGGTTACTYLARTQVAESLGAQAIVIAHNTTAAAPILTASMTTVPVKIPAVSITQAAGNAIKAALADGALSADVRQNPLHPGIRDGDLENGIIAHEYGHGISLRLTGGPGINCLGGTEQMGEGWSDYFAITLAMNPSIDDPEVARGMGPYALFQDDRHGAGIRSAPYTRDMKVQPFTYDRIKTGGWLNGTSLAAPHGVGHAWAATLWDMNWDLVDKYGFSPNIYDNWTAGGNNLGLQLVIDGLKLQGCNPTFTKGRDAIIAADAALTGGDNYCLLWSTFARRGLGASAVGGTTDRNDGKEAFDVPAECMANNAKGVPGFNGPQVKNAPTLATVEAGTAVPLKFSLGADKGLDILKKSVHATASQQISCTTLEPLQYAITLPTSTPGNSAALSFSKGNKQYQYVWKSQADWADTCRQFIMTFNDGTQLRANVQFTAPLVVE
jgi:hypothetical protein